MTFKYVNLVRFKPTAGGSGGWTVDEAVDQYLTPEQAGCADGDRVTYSAFFGSTEAEIGEAIVSIDAGVTTLSRDVIRRSSNSNEAVDFTGPPTIEFVLLAEDFVSRGPRVQSFTSSDSITPDVDLYDVVEVTALAESATLQNPVGTPHNRQRLEVFFKDDGTGRSLDYDTDYEAGEIELPDTTEPGEELGLVFIYNGHAGKWRLMGLTGGF
jgi:hypothetical protein